ncbi:DUF2399 domain-containing protein [Amycolatopsis eburnea]|uniref:DUF2399 domain-containing protein n=1 Tax=Amycolatopsis eburnea TaxID=2267691 RepID=A0A3R9DFZ5_9PSEU|nr:DUF2399 domain-containing protein [Amycolatopsis eburnea]RSD13555.1 DUF2399 domain-containing protein [Amycolatopsis eburnea]
MSDQRIPIGGLPAGVVATAFARKDGSIPRDRRGRTKTTHVRLTSGGTGVTPGTPIDGIAANDLKWVLASSRRYWSSLERRFGAAARDMVLHLTAAGVVDVLCSVGEDLRIDAVRRWDLTAAWDTHRRTREDHEQNRVETWRSRAEAAAGRVVAIDPGLAQALTSNPSANARLAVLVHAAEDLADGITHDGPRAFSQAHFDGTKDREDAADILAACGVQQSTLLALGVLRSPYLGLGGPMVVQDPNGQEFSLAGLAGPVRFRATGLSLLAPAIVGGTPTMAVIENLQAAEAVCDRFPEVAVTWCAGQPAEVVVGLIAKLAAGVEHVIVATDADLGGVRIANRIVTALTGQPDVLIVDAGAHAHPARSPFGRASIDGLTALAEGPDPIARFAGACLDRGYPVEQEATIRAALNAILGS